MANPFGIQITADDIIESLGFFDEWESRYQYIIDLGKELPEMNAALKIDQNLVRGCQSQVWMVHSLDEDGHFHFEVDSDAFIVKGLLAIVMSAYNGKTAHEILEFDIEHYFAELDLLKHLSQTRGNGLRAMVEKIRSFCSQN